MIKKIDFSAENPPVPKKPAETVKVQPKKETIRIALPQIPEGAGVLLEKKTTAPIAPEVTKKAQAQRPVQNQEKKLPSKKFKYVAMDSRGKETKGILDGLKDQNEALNRLKEMGFFPTKVIEVGENGEEKNKKEGEEERKNLPKKNTNWLKKNFLRLILASGIGIGGGITAKKTGEYIGKKIGEKSNHDLHWGEKHYAKRETTKPFHVESIQQPPVSPPIFVPYTETTNAPTSVTNTEPTASAIALDKLAREKLLTEVALDEEQMATAELSNKLNQAQAEAEATAFSNKLAQAEMATATFSNKLAKAEVEAKRAAEIKKQLEEKLTKATSHTPTETSGERRNRITRLLENRDDAKREGKSQEWIMKNYPFTSEDAAWWNTH